MSTCTIPPDVSAGPRSIRNARTLFEALMTPDTATRFNALRAIQAQPEAALAFGIYKGSDVIDVMLAQAADLEDTLEWTSWVGALAGFRDQRVVEFFLTILATAERPQVLFSAARYLSSGDTQILMNALLPLLLQNENPTRARATAPLLQASELLSSEARLRIALLTETAAGGQSFEKASSNLWLAELAGPFRKEAMRALRAQGEGVWTALALEWNKLTEDGQVWLLQWGLEEFGAMVGGLLPEALRSNLRRVRIEALRALANLPASAVSQPVRAMALPLLEDADAEVRALAASASPAGPDWGAFIEHEVNPLVRRAAVIQLARTEGKRAIPDLLQLLCAENWQVRAVAAESLVSLGMAAAEAVKPLVHDDDQNVRIAAARILLDLEQDSWLQLEFGIGEG